MLPFLPAAVRAISSSPVADGMLNRALPTAAPQAEPQAEAGSGRRVSSGLPRQCSEMALQQSRLLEAVSCRKPRLRRTEPNPTAAAGPAAAPEPSCKQQLGSGLKIFHGRGLVTIAEK